jgi:hypothetical protein
LSRLGADGDLESRVIDLIERGLTAYGAGDLHSAMSYWKHALALDEDNRRALEYVAYVKRLFDVADEVPAQNAFAEPDAELEVPFGLVDVHPVTEIDYGALDRPAPVSREIDDEFGDEQPTRVSLAAQASELDEGWSLGDSGRFEADMFTRNPRPARPRVTYEMAEADIDIGGLADVLEPEDEPPLAEGTADLDDVEALDPDPDAQLEDEIASVREGLLIAESGAIELEAESAEPGWELAESDEFELDLEPAFEPQAYEAAPPLELEAFEAPEARPPAPRATAFGYKPTIKPHAATLRGMPEAEDSPQSIEPADEVFELEAEPAEPVADDAAVPIGVPRPAEAIVIGDIEPLDEPSASRELEPDLTPETADVTAPPDLGELDEPPGSLRRHPARELGAREIDALSFELDPLAEGLGPPPEVDATPPPQRPIDPNDLDLELGKAGTRTTSDVKISFRAPGAATRDFGREAKVSDAGFEQGIPMGLDAAADDDDDELSISIEPAGGGLEDQLAELEIELRTSGGSIEWRTHDSGIRPRVDHAPVPDSPAPAPASEQRGPDSDGIAAEIAADVEREARPGESPDDRLRRRIFGFIDRADVEMRRERYSVAVIAADLAMSEGPDSAIAQKLIHQRHALLLEVFRRFLGDLERVPAVALPMHEISMQELDHRTAFLLSRIDGTLSFEDILDISGMPRLEALRYLCRLRLQGILEVR